MTLGSTERGKFRQACADLREARGQFVDTSRRYTQKDATALQVNVDQHKYLETSRATLALGLFLGIRMETVLWILNKINNPTPSTNR